MWETVNSNGRHILAGTNDAGEVYDGSPDSNDASYPTSPGGHNDFAYRIDAPGMENTQLAKQLAYRGDFTEIGEWYTGSGWVRITSDVNAKWCVELTGNLPNNAAGNPTKLSTGHNASNVPNQRPVAAGVGKDLKGNVGKVAKGEKFLLLPEGSTDADNDSKLTGDWTQTAGPVATQVSGSIYEAPNQAGDMEFSLIVTDDTGELKAHKPNNSSSNNNVTVTVTVE